MAKRKTSDIDTENTEIESLDETAEEITKKEEINEEELTPKGTPYKVFRIDGESIFLEDMKGNGWKFPIPEKYKNAKKGDIIYL